MLDEDAVSIGIRVRRSFASQDGKIPVTTNMEYPR